MSSTGTEQPAGRHVEVRIPPLAELLAKGTSVSLARRGQRWSATCLGTFASERGVYLIHHAGTLKYVGKTDAPGMSFGMRLRREFTESGSGARHIYRLLESLAVPPSVQVSFLPAAEVRSLVTTTTLELQDHQRIRMLETVLTQVYEPEYQKHQPGRRRRQL